MAGATTRNRTDKIIQAVEEMKRMYGIKKGFVFDVSDIESVLPEYTRREIVNTVNYLIRIQVMGRFSRGNYTL